MALIIALGIYVVGVLGVSSVLSDIGSENGFGDSLWFLLLAFLWPALLVALPVVWCLCVVGVALKRLKNKKGS